jgi:hypothetical protein
MERRHGTVTVDFPSSGSDLLDQCLSAEVGQSDEAFMRALPQSVPIMRGKEVAHPGASREHPGDHFERRLEILCLAARSPMPEK